MRSYIIEVGLITNICVVIDKQKSKNNTNKTIDLLEG